MRRHAEPSHLSAWAPDADAPRIQAGRPSWLRTSKGADVKALSGTGIWRQPATHAVGRGGIAARTVAGPPLGSETPRNDAVRSVEMRIPASNRPFFVERRTVSAVLRPIQRFPLSWT